MSLVPGVALEACASFLWGDGSFSISIFDETLASFLEMKYFCHHVYCPSQEPN